MLQLPLDYWNNTSPLPQEREGLTSYTEVYGAMEQRKVPYRYRCTVYFIDSFN